MTTHIEQAKTAAHVADNRDPRVPAYTNHVLRGILHALLALHEQGAATPRPTTRAPRATKEQNK